MTEALFDFASRQQVKLPPDEQGLPFVPSGARGKVPLIWTSNDESTGGAVRRASISRPPTAASVSTRIRLNEGAQEVMAVALFVWVGHLAVSR